MHRINLSTDFNEIRYGGLSLTELPLFRVLSKLNTPQITPVPILFLWYGAHLYNLIVTCDSVTNEYAGDKKGIYKLIILLSVLMNVFKFYTINHCGCKITRSLLSETEEHRLCNNVVTAVSLPITQT
jgi:hypothetical protein